MKVTPTRCVALIRPDTVEEKTEGGILLPDVVKDRQQSAITEERLLLLEMGSFRTIRGRFQS